jgi:hypothetical protein
MRRNKASNKLVDAGGKKVTCIQEVPSLNHNHGIYYPDGGLLWFTSVTPGND